MATVAEDITTLPVYSMEDSRLWTDPSLYAGNMPSNYTKARMLFTEGLRHELIGLIDDRLASSLAFTKDLPGTYKFDMGMEIYSQHQMPRAQRVLPRHTFAIVCIARSVARAAERRAMQNKRTITVLRMSLRPHQHAEECAAKCQLVDKATVVYRLD